MDTTSATFRLRFSDRLAFAMYHCPRSPIMLVMIGFLMLLVTFGTIIPVVREFGHSHSVVAMIFAFCFLETILLILVIIFWALITVLTMVSRRNKTLYCERKITLGEESFMGESEYGKSETRWTIVQKLARTRKHIFLYLAAENAVLIPRRAFESAAQWESFYAYCRQRVGDSKTKSK